jgi:hypothetical protein
MKTKTPEPIATRPDSRLPWRVVFYEGFWQVWTRQNDTPGNRNNYVIADGIQTEAEAYLIAAAPTLLAACNSVCNSWESGRLDVAAQECAVAIIKAEAP